jgi:iron(III) transport system ATP-binding protein
MQKTRRDTRDEGMMEQNWGARGTAGVSFASALSFENVTVDLGGARVLDTLNMSLNPGEIVCLLGESGSGKSTILRAAAGIQKIDAGIVRINSEMMSGEGVHVQPERRGVGLMFQDFALFPHMTLLENTAFGLSRLGRKAALQRAHAALQRVGLAGREHDYPNRLSGGQQQRLALARTIAPRPGVLLMDEPFSSLDARLRESVRAETLAVLRETRATSVIVTHDPEEAMLLGDRIALLRAGKIVQIDTASEIYRAPADLGAARFFSVLNEIEARVRSGVAETPFGPVPAPRKAEGQKVIVAIRPVGVVDMTLTGDGVPGRVLSRRDALGTDIYEVKVEGLDHPLHLRRSSDMEYIPGRDVFLSLNPELVLVFDAV